MPEPLSGLRLFTIEEANACLPRIRALLSRLKDLRRLIVGLQAKVDIEEMTSGLAVEKLLKEMEAQVHIFHGLMQELQATGCELKDLEKGLVDFYGMHEGDIVYWCWQEGEASITHWHKLDAGFQGRQKLG
jgi:hypothetical protein